MTAEPSAPFTVPLGFVNDPIASHSGQFGLARPEDGPAGTTRPSPTGVRPWNLRAAEPVAARAAGRARLSGWRYDHDLQVAVTATGQPVSEIVAADPSADSVSHLDGDEGNSEDWRYDYYPDHPGPTK
ncbi:hypothetical protein [Amycolatopsis sp. CA-230715]|uniref:hypothetical protein n=1 Tax=Amycolatopsis sp. CA-230715 TaxID=2745196 RepID=UPI001C0193A2|nr:hypothetical protein [Amycolatopsis sp. CA-230715]QWF85800.1 hypothetical protein HUW46_09280 [Amycolatopsis sp. CA-230715]